MRFVPVCSQDKFSFSLSLCDTFCHGNYGLVDEGLVSVRLQRRNKLPPLWSALLPMFLQ